MQNAKDTFLITLRDRLAALNPARTVVLRSAVRPAVITMENELPANESEPFEAFLLRWTGHTADLTETMPLDAAQCQIRYTTLGTAEAAGMDRGRVLDAMDGELTGMLLPAQTPKINFAASPALALGTNIFWSSPEFGPAEMKDGALSRVVTVTVFAFREAGE